LGEWRYNSIHGKLFENRELRRKCETKTEKARWRKLH
jgi:hypothetical protein